MTWFLLDWRTWVIAVAVLCLMPSALLLVFVRLYPKGHPRRAELVAELFVRPQHERPFFVLQCLKVSFAEAIPARWLSRQTRGVESDSEAITLVTLNYDRLMEAELAKLSTPLDAGEWEKTLKLVKIHGSVGHEPGPHEPFIDGALIVRMAAFNAGFFQAEPPGQQRRWLPWLRRSRRPAR